MFKFHNPSQLIDRDLKLALVEKYPGDPSIGYVPAYKFNMIHVGGEALIGRIELRVGNTNHLVMYAGHMGYEVMSEYRGHGYAARACKLLFPLAKSHGLKTLWITCNPNNIASIKTCERLGGFLMEIVDLPQNTDMYREGERQKCRYKIDL